MKRGVPTTVPRRVRKVTVGSREMPSSSTASSAPVSVEIASERAESPSASRERAIPKSRTLTTPSSVTMTLSGLRSRWITPARWAAARASATRCPISSWRSRGREAPSSSESVLPSMSSSTRKSPPSVSISSWMRQMPGWSRRERIRASLRNRALASSERRPRSRRVLTATRRSRAAVETAVHLTHTA